MGIAAIVAQYVTFQPLFRQMGMGPVGSAFGMLMFFTILTNILLVVVYWSAISGSAGRAARFFGQVGVRTAIAAQITLVAIVYEALIRGQLPLTWPMMITDALLHNVAPLVYLIWWWLLPAKQSLSYAQIPRWILWPITYLAFIMAWGVITGGFLYPFLDLNKLGTGIVSINIALLIALLAAICSGLNRISRFQAGDAGAGP